MFGRNESKKLLRTSVDFSNGDDGVNVNVKSDSAVISAIETALRFIPILTNSYALLSGMGMRRFMESDAINNNTEGILEKLVESNKDRAKSIEDFNSKFSELFSSTRRGRGERRSKEPWPRVEIAPGAYKTERMTYPPDFFASRLRHLIHLKEKEEKKKG
ncbi:uncharacterized protein LOC142979621 [Anticarsia gemmatalis]|uniref:uncharacterized protein LOC142979621 n=1 Tax=Anticarsia gemmatalis TaxID=129554 RepID=UPI003F757518